MISEKWGGTPAYQTSRACPCSQQQALKLLIRFLLRSDWSGSDIYILEYNGDATKLATLASENVFLFNDKPISGKRFAGQIETAFEPWFAHAQCKWNGALLTMLKLWQKGEAFSAET